jgi:acyl-coenzyme A thioesterase PaaI-like protein
MNESLAANPAPTRTYKLYRATERLPFGRAIFTELFKRVAPYFQTIPATIESAKPGLVVATMRDTRRVRNHLGTVHAIAMCNLAEMTMGLAAEATIPTSHRWIPKSMGVQYLAKAQGTLTATATLPLPEPLGDKQEITVPVAVTDRGGREVFHADIVIWVTARPAG